MPWNVLFDDDFNLWFTDLEADEADEILANLGVLQEFGPNLGRPRVDSVESSAFSNMKELRVQIRGKPWRILFAFDPKRSAILLVGGNKAGNKRWYKVNVPIADARFQRHLDRLERG